MSDPTNYTNPLSGAEVVEDVLAQIRKRLRTDCSLRNEDGYSGGYSGEIVIKLRCHAVRIAEISMTIPIAAETAAPSPEAFGADGVDSVEIDETISIPLEPNLTAVRQRTADNNSDQEEAEPEPQGDELESNLVQRRKYTRRPTEAGVAAVTE